MFALVRDMARARDVTDINIAAGTHYPSITRNAQYIIGAVMATLTVATLLLCIAYSDLSNRHDQLQAKLNTVLDNQVRYMERAGIEPATSALQKPRSSS